MQAASRAYFDKDVGELSLSEMAYLAVLPKAPNNYNPFRPHDRAMERRNWVLGQMAENGYITGAERDAATAQPLGAIRPYQIRPDRMGSWFVEDVRRELMNRTSTRLTSSHSCASRMASCA